MIVHETVAEVVDAVVVDPHEIPGLKLHERSGRRVDAAVLGDDFCDILKTVVFFLVDSGKLRDEECD